MQQQQQLMEPPDIEQQANYNTGFSPEPHQPSHTCGPGEQTFY